MTFRNVAGHCPMGCGRTLFLDDDDAVICSFSDCPRRTAVDELLADREREHVVEITGSEFTVRHPLHERLDDQLMACQLHAYLASRDGPPIAPGRWRVTWPGPGRGFWTQLPEPTTAPDSEETPA